MVIVFKVLDVVFLIGLVIGLRWAWDHQREILQRVAENDAMPRDATRGLIYGLIFFFVAGIIIVNTYWLFS